VAELGETGNVIPRYPEFGKLAAGNAENAAEINLHAFPRGREWPHWAALRSAVTTIKCHQVPFGHDMLGINALVRKSDATLGIEALEVFAGADVHFRRRLTMADEVGRQQFVECLMISVVDGLGEAADKSLVLLSRGLWHVYLPDRFLPAGCNADATALSSDSHRALPAEQIMTSSSVFAK
jgi:hypothetical protein